jgi:hypothetical protein
MSAIFSMVKYVDVKIQKDQAYKIIKENKLKAFGMIYEQKKDLYCIAENLKYFLPKTSAKILECIRENKMPEKPLFNRFS